MRFPNRLAVPACAFRVDLAEKLLVGFGGPLEGVGELGFVDLVVMVDEDPGFLGGVIVVCLWRELMSVPGQINVQGRDGYVVLVSGEDFEITPVFDEQAIHGGAQSGRVHPVNGVHFFDKGALANNGADEIEGEH